MPDLRNEARVEISVSLTAAYAILDALTKEIQKQFDWANSERMANGLSASELDLYDDKVAGLRCAKDEVIGAILIATRPSAGGVSARE